MPQKPLKVAKKIQKPSGNRHGRKPNMKKGEEAHDGTLCSLDSAAALLTPLLQHAGAFDIKPKKSNLLQKYKDEKVRSGHTCT